MSAATKGIGKENIDGMTDAVREYMERLINACGIERYEEIKYDVIAQGDKVAVLGSAKVDGEPRTWAQVFRMDGDQVVETWWSGWSLSMDTVKALAEITGLGNSG